MNENIRKYRYFLFDLWGVIYDGKKKYKGIIKFLKSLKKSKKKLYIISNTSKSKKEVLITLKKLNLDKFFNKIFTSGDYAKSILNLKNKKVFLINGINKKNKKFANLYKFKIVKNIKEANIFFAGSINKKFTKKNILRNINLALKYNLEMICINPDLLDVNLNLGMGYYANLYKNRGGKVKYFGKPNLNFYKFIIKDLKIKNKKQILCIGDTIYNDIKGASNLGIDSLLVKKSGLFKFKFKNMILFNFLKNIEAKYEINSFEDYS